ncbi:MAG TPA: hypothetical protein P5244_06115 [Syntrophales bacterium]|nr:hypothetical protein [Syntrophales bacterium]
MHRLEEAEREDMGLRNLMADLKKLPAMRVAAQGQGKAYEAFKALGSRPPEKAQALGKGFPGQYFSLNWSALDQITCFSRKGHTKFAMSFIICLPG